MINFSAHLVWWFNHPILLAVVIYVIVFIMYAAFYRHFFKNSPLIAITVGSSIALGVSAMVAAQSFAWLAPSLNARIIYNQGIDSTGKVIAVEGSGIMVNEVSIKRHRVVYRLENGEVMESSFLTMGQMYPKPKRVMYPITGQSFNLRYLPDYPQYFVIVPDMTLDHCLGLLDSSSELKSRLSFEPDNLNIKQQLDEFNQQYDELDCRTRWENFAHRD